MVIPGTVKGLPGEGEGSSAERCRGGWIRGRDARHLSAPYRAPAAQRCDPAAGGAGCSADVGCPLRRGGAGGSPDPFPALPPAAGGLQSAPKGRARPRRRLRCARSN